jgi:hypothetical protein
MYRGLKGWLTDTFVASPSQEERHVDSKVSVKLKVDLGIFGRNAGPPGAALYSTF